MATDYDLCVVRRGQMTFINVVRLRSINIKSIIYCLALSHNHYQAKISTTTFNYSFVVIS